MTNVITGVKVKELRNLPKFIEGVGPVLEYKFKLNFKKASEVLGKTKRIRVVVRQQGNGIKSKIEVTMIKPGKTEQENLELFTSKSKPPSRNITAKINSPGGFKEISFDDGNTLVNVNPDLGGNPIPPLPPSDDFERFEYLIQENDPDGVWTLRIKNRGVQAEDFFVEIDHPDMQLKLVESKIPFSLLNRLLKKVNRLIEVKIGVDNDLTLDFSKKFKDMTGLEKMKFHIGTNTATITTIPEPLTGLAVLTTDIDYALKDINLDSIGFKIVPKDGNAVALSAHLVFETSGSNEIVVAGPNVNIRKLELKGDIAFKGAFVPIYVEERNLAGKLLASHPPASKMELSIEPTINTDKFLVFKTQEGIQSGVNSAVEKLIKSNSTQSILSVIAEHLTDMLLFLASGKDNQVLYDLQPTATDIVVRHYDRPSARLRLLDNHLTPSTDDVGVHTTATTANFGLPTMKTMPFTMTAMHVAAPQGNHQKTIKTASFAFPFMKAATFASTVNAPTVNAPTTPGKHRKIEHIVVMMLENRSFDHMLGYLTKKKNRTDIDGLSSNESNPVPGSTISHSVFRLTDGGIIDVDPGHSVDEVKEQIADGAMSGFVSNYMSKKKIKARPGDEKLVMSFYDDETLDVYDFLADEYLVCDRWFCSHPGATYPNRFISVMGSTPDVRNFELDSNEIGTVKGDTVFDVLSREKVDWKYVESNISFLRMFDKYRVDEQNIIQRDAWMNKARSGQLPAVSWIDPHIVNLEREGEADDDHPPANVAKGQDGVREVYNALTANPAHWNKTLFILTYDEHGGFYDHVPPHGLNGETNLAVHKIHEDGETFYGPRVPAIIISPWVEKRSVSHKVFDHTSILKTILLNFIGPEAATKELLGKRTDAANSLLDLLEERNRGEIPRLNASTNTTSNSGPRALSEQPLERDSFHDGFLLFGFGPKLRRIITDRITDG